VVAGADNSGVVRCAEAGWYRWCRLAAASVAIGGGGAMIGGVLVARRSALLPLFLFGAAWIAVGVAIAWQGWLVREIVVTGGVARFISASACIEVAAADIIVIGHSHPMAPLAIETSSDGTIKAVPRLDGLIEVVAELRRSNPALLVDNIL
jgi:hypothetical protein